MATALTDDALVAGVRAGDEAVFAELASLRTWVHRILVNTAKARGVRESR